MIDRDKLAIDAMENHFGNQGPAHKVSAFIDERFRSTGARPQEMDPLRQEEIATHHEEISREIARQNQEMRERFRADTAQYTPKAPNSRVVGTTFGPNNGSGGPYYSLNWTRVDNPTGDADSASADITTGHLGASRDTIQGTWSANAAVGAWLIPGIQWCHMLIAPYISWQGFSMAKTHKFDPATNEQEWGGTGGYLSIVVNSWDLAGGSPNRDGEIRVPLWEIIAQNPNESQNRSGTRYGGDYTLNLLATSNRQYAIWAVCHAWVRATRGFSLETMASSSLTCIMYSLEVRETPA